MKTILKSRKSSITKWMRYSAVGISTLFLLQACGGSGAGAGGPGSGPAISAVSSDATSLKATSVVVLSSQPNLPSDGKTKATLTVIVKDSGNRALENAVVDLSTTDAGSFIQFDTRKTGPDGTIKATLTSTGKGNRVIPVVAVVGANKSTIDIPVSGTAMTLSGPQSIAVNNTGKYSLALRDSSGIAFANAPVTLSSQSGNTFTPATVITDANGQASFTINAAKTGPDVVTVAAAGSSSTIAFTVASAQIQLDIAANDEVLVGTLKTVTVRLTDVAGAANKPISVSSTRGTVAPSTGSVTTDGSGVATFTVRSLTAGIGTINVTGPSGTSTSANVEFVSKVPAAIRLVPSSPIVASNPAGSSGNSSQLLATVRDATGNPVKGVRVNFSADLDPSNGLIQPGFALTDASGVATVAFLAGASASGPNGVSLKVNVEGSPAISATTQLTVTNGGISIRIGTNNVLEIEGDVRNNFKWTALVVDSAGKPIPDAPVSIQVVPIAYYKGSWFNYGSQSSFNWGRATPSRECFSEDGLVDQVTGAIDINKLDGVKQESEDINGSGKLEPGNIASSSFVNGTNVTNSSGFADFTINWAISYSLFAKIRIDVKTLVRGTEASVSESFVLPLRVDSAERKTPPAIYNTDPVTGQIIAVGPFGSVTSDTLDLSGAVVKTACQNPN
jgi:Bacterial Ig-like domain (group 1)